MSPEKVVISAENIRVEGWSTFKQCYSNMRQHFWLLFFALFISAGAIKIWGSNFSMFTDDGQKFNTHNQTENAE